MSVETANPIIEKTSARFETDIREIHALYTNFCSSLDLSIDFSDLSDRSYHPVTDRWHIESLRKIKDIRGLLQFRNEMLSNLRTNLKERFLVIESVGRMFIRDGQVYSEDFPKEPFSDVILRGQQYRKTNALNESNSKKRVELEKDFDREGEFGELAGWAYIESAMLTYDVGTTVMSFSPPSENQGSVYKFRFVDFFTVREENGVRYVERSRLAVNWTRSDYEDHAQKINPDFFKDYDGRSKDAWFLSHPQIINSDMVSIVSGFKDNGMDASDFDALFNDPMLERLIGHYATEISALSVNWENIALAFNSILNYADELKRLMTVGRSGEGRRYNSNHEINNVAFKAYIDMLGRQSVATVAGGGCPPNKGLKLGGTGLLGTSLNLGNSVAQFGSALDGEKQGFDCPSCGGWIPWGSGDKCPNCHITKQKYAQESGSEVC